MRSNYLKIFFLFTSIWLSGCVSVQSVSLTQIPKKRNKVVSTEVSKMIFFGLNFNNDYVNGIVENLKQKCPEGKVQGILTKDEHINYFLGIVAERHIQATGYCSVSKKQRKKRRS